VLRAARADLRCDSAALQLRRADKKAKGGFLPDADAILRALLERSLPALGLIDRARDDGAGARLRLSSAGRALVRGAPPASGRPRAGQGAAAPRETARWEAGGRLRAGPSVTVARVLAVAPIVSAIPREDHLVLALDRARIDEVALRDGLDALRSSLAALAPLDADASRLLAAAQRPTVGCELVATAAYVAIPDDALRATVAADTQLGRLIARRLADGVLLLPGASVERFERRLNKLGGTIRRAPEGDPSDGDGSQR